MLTTISALKIVVFLGVVMAETMMTGYRRVSFTMHQVGGLIHPAKIVTPPANKTNRVNIMSFWILFIFFGVLSLWVWAGVSFFYRDIFLASNFLESVDGVNGYYLLATIFATGIPLWLTTVFYLFKMWQLRFFDFHSATFYLFLGYFSLFYMLLGHIYPPFWVTMLILHIICLILVIRNISRSSRRLE